MNAWDPLEPSFQDPWALAADGYAWARVLPNHVHVHLGPDLLVPILVVDVVQKPKRGSPHTFSIVHVKTFDRV